MPTYATGEPEHFSDNQQHNAYYDNSHFDPYNTHRIHDSIDQGQPQEPYHDEPSQVLSQGASTDPLNHGTKETYTDPFNVNPRPVGSPRSVRAWRYKQGRPLWKQGGGLRCCCRFLFCSVFITLFLIIVIVLCLVLWMRPPDVIIGDGSNTSPVVVQSVNVVTNGLEVGLGLPVTVVNPNYFSAKLTHVKANIYYPINSTLIGNGTLNNVNLPSHSTTNFTFPFLFDYTTSIDRNFSIITDIAKKCLTSPQSDLTIKYELNVGVKVFFVKVSPTITNSVSFTCPISTSDIESLLKQIGLSNIIGSSGTGLF